MFSLHVDTARTWRGGQNQVLLTVLGLSDQTQRLGPRMSSYLASTHWLTAVKGQWNSPPKAHWGISQLHWSQTLVRHVALTLP